MVLNYTDKSYRTLNELLGKWMDDEKGWLQNVTLGTVVMAWGFSPMFARACIVIGAFLSIRKLPASAYETLSLSQSFPDLKGCCGWVACCDRLSIDIGLYTHEA